MSNNNQLILISGASSTGKSASLQNIRNKEKWLYLNCESGKELPFASASKFESHVITDPYQVHEAFEYGIDNEECEGIIVDSLTFLMDMFNSLYIYNSADGRSAWSDYQQFFKKMMQDLVPQFNRPTIFIAHTRSEFDEALGRYRTAVPIQGALKNTGIESYFSTVVSTKVVSLKELEPYTKNNDLLTITDDDLIVEQKYVFQTRLTKTTIGETIRSPIGFFTVEQTYMNNDAQLILDHLKQKYEE